MPNSVPVTLRGGSVAYVDQSDYAIVSGYKWHPERGKNTTYAVTQLYRGGKRLHIKMHQLILPGNPIVDHRDGDGLNNRRGNLRGATNAQNTRNSRGHKDRGGSRYKGVWRDPDRVARPWQPSICVNGRQVHLGQFSSEEFAARVYDAAARQLHGEFARLNFPGDPIPSSLMGVDFNCLPHHPLAHEQRDVLCAIRSRGGAASPMEIGASRGRQSVYHILTSLSLKGYLKKNNFPSLRYWITEAGEAKLLERHPNYSQEDM